MTEVLGKYTLINYRSLIIPHPRHNSYRFLFLFFFFSNYHLSTKVTFFMQRLNVKPFLFWKKRLYISNANRFPTNMFLGLFSTYFGSQLSDGQSLFVTICWSLSIIKWCHKPNTCLRVFSVRERERERQRERERETEREREKKQMDLLSHTSRTISYYLFFKLSCCI